MARPFIIYGHDFANCFCELSLSGRTIQNEFGPWNAKPWKVEAFKIMENLTCVLPIGVGTKGNKQGGFGREIPNCWLHNRRALPRENPNL